MAGHVSSGCKLIHRGCGQNLGLFGSSPCIHTKNAYVERYKRTVRYDWLAHHLFESLDEIQDFATRWLWTYIHDLPNMALGGITPKQKLALAA